MRISRKNASDALRLADVAVVALSIRASGLSRYGGMPFRTVDGDLPCQTAQVYDPDSPRLMYVISAFVCMDRLWI